MDKNNLSDLKKFLRENSLDAALISSLSNIVYLTKFSHFTEIEREGFVLITKNNQYVITDRRYSHAVKTNLPNFELLEISGNNSFTTLLQDAINLHKISVLGIEENDLTVHEHKKVLLTIKNTKHFDLRKLRILKTKDEIRKIKNACLVGDKAFLNVLKKIKSGMTEKELAFEIEHFIKKEKCGLSFPTIVAFGKHAAIPHHKTGNKKLKENELILIDFGVKYENYCSDMTRTIFYGKAAKQQKNAYKVVKEAQEKAIKQFNITKNAKDLDEAARSYIASKGYSSMPHSLGHGIGLQVHEAPSLSPNSNDILSEGMVFSIEPGIYFPDKFGIRIEDLFAIENNKLKQLTKSSRSLIELKIK